MQKRRIRNYKKMLKLPEEKRNDIVKIISNSQMPINQGLMIINILTSLQPVEELPANPEKNG